MARRTAHAAGSNSEKIRAELVALLENFEGELKRPQRLREKILGLVPANHLMRNLGVSLFIQESARDRILAYLQKFVGKEITSDELAVVAGISEFARRIRELRTEFGWPIATGVTMTEESGMHLPPDSYVLISTEQDRDAAFRWATANEIRKSKEPIKARLVKFLLANIGKKVTNEELRYVAGDATEWARRVRELRSEEGWSIATKATTGRADLPNGTYLLESTEQAEPHDRKISDEARCASLERDKFQCVHCGWKYEMANPADRRQRLEPHHVKHHVDGGTNDAGNLITLCNVCHDKQHSKEAAASKTKRS